MDAPRAEPSAQVVPGRGPATVLGDWSGSQWRVPSGVLFLAVAGAYALGAHLAILGLEVTGLQAVVYPPAGITAAALLRTPTRQWWVVLAGAAGAETALGVNAGVWSAATIGGYVAANVLEPLVGAALVRRWVGLVDLIHRRHVVAFLVAAVLVAPALGAAVGATADQLFADGPWLETWWQWWLGDAAGVALIGIGILAWGSSPDRRRITWPTALLLVTASAGTGLAAYAGPWSLAFLVLIVVVMAGSAVGVRGVAVSALSIAATTSIALTTGPVEMIFRISPDVAVVLVTTELMVFVFVGLWVAAESQAFARDERSAVRAAAEDEIRRRESSAQARVDRVLEDYRLLFEQATDGIFVADAAGRYLDVNPAGAAMLGHSRDELLGMSVADVLDPDELRRLEAEIAERSDAATADGRLRFRRGDGTAFLGEVVGHRLPDGRYQSVLRDVTEADRTSRALVDSEAQLRSVFTAIDEGFCICEMIVDSDGRPVDYRFLDVNPLFEDMTGLHGAAGRTALELVPGLEPFWVETYGRVGLGRETLRFEQGSPAMGRWFDVFAMPLSHPGRFAVVFKDQTERRRTDLALRSAAELSAFRVRLEDAVRPIADPVRVQEVAAAVLGEHLGALRVHYLDVDPSGLSGVVHVDYHPGTSTVIGRHRFDAFSGPVMDDFLAGRLVAVSDVAHDDRLTDRHRAALAELGICSYVVSPLVKEARVVAALAVHAGAARVWSDDELSLIGETTERTWSAVQRARAEEALALARTRAELVADVLADLEARSTLPAQLQALVEALVPRMCDRASVHAADRPDLMLAGAEVDPEEASRARLLAAAAEPDAMSAVVARAAAGEAVLVGLAPLDGGQVDATTSGRETRGTPQSIMAVPLAAGHRTGAALVLARDQPGPAFAADDLDFVQDVARRADLVLTATRLRQEEHDIAVRLQQALLPDEIRWHPNLVPEARYAAAGEFLEVGGDWYDTFGWPDGRIGLIVGDVVGHNLESAAAMGRLRAATAALAADTAPSPADLLDAVDRFAQGPDGCDYVTAVAVVVDPRNGRLTYSSAAHPPVIVIPPDRVPLRLLDAQWLPLGGHEPGARPEAEIMLEPGSLVIMYTDGLVERPGEPLENGLQRLERSAVAVADLPLADVADRLVEDLTAHSPANDDVVVTCFRYTPARGRCELQAPAAAGQLAGLRSGMRRWLIEEDIPVEVHDRVVLAIGEACSNVVQHAYHRGSADRLTVELSDHGYHVAATVTDTGRWRPTGDHRRTGGRGTPIMQALTQRFARFSDDGGTRVMLALPSPRPVSTEGR